jgi:hypothetical protein
MDAVRVLSARSSFDVCAVADPALRAADTAVHQACYGISAEAAKQDKWFCATCQEGAKQGEIVCHHLLTFPSQHPPHSRADGSGV